MPKGAPKIFVYYETKYRSRFMFFRNELQKPFLALFM